MSVNGLYVYSIRVFVNKWTIYTTKLFCSASLIWREKIETKFTTNVQTTFQHGISSNDLDYYSTLPTNAISTSASNCRLKQL